MNQNSFELATKSSTDEAVTKILDVHVIYLNTYFKFKLVIELTEKVDTANNDILLDNLDLVRVRTGINKLF